MNGERFYTALLHLYPRGFREEYRDDMLATFREMRAHRTGSAMSFWTFVLRDTMSAAARQRLDATRWLATAVCGLLVTTAAGDGLAWTYRYFYHPYFERVAIRALPYGVALGVALGLVLGTSVALAQRLLFPSAERPARQWALASAIALPVAVLFCSAAIDRAAAGVMPIANNHPALLEIFVLRVIEPQGWIDLGTQFAAMTASAAVVRALLFTLLTSPMQSPRSRHAH